MAYSTPNVVPALLDRERGGNQEPAERDQTMRCCHRWSWSRPRHGCVRVFRVQGVMLHLIPHTWPSLDDAIAVMRQDGPAQNNLAAASLGDALRSFVVCCRKQTGDFGPDCLMSSTARRDRQDWLSAQVSACSYLLSQGTSRPKLLDVETDDLEPLQVVRELPQ